MRPRPAESDRTPTSFGHSAQLAQGGCQFILQNCDNFAACDFHLVGTRNQSVTRVAAEVGCAGFTSGPEGRACFALLPALKPRPTSPALPTSPYPPPSTL